MLQQQTGAPLTLFYSYAHEDESLREQLEKHLRLLSRQGLISEWHDRQIVAGTEWEKEIDEHLNIASIILLLVSPDFLASDYCYDVEMQRALERHNLHEAHVIPILLRPCDWHSAPFGCLQCVPHNGKAVTEWDNQDAAFRDVAQGIRRAIEQQAPPVLSSVAQQNRLRLLKRVRQTWIEGVLEQSLHQAALIALDMQDRPDALANPWQLDVQETNRPPRPLPAGTSIVEVYDDADGELLILGEPGAGKTTLLLELTRTLLERAEGAERAPLPVLFNLSCWAEKCPPLMKWLVEELWTKYQVPRTLGNVWIATGQILPLLDGLDEVAEDTRSNCVQAINTYQQDRLEKGPAPLVVCCRSQEYMALPTHVNLHQAVSIQPLTDEQIERYLQSAKGQLEVLRHALHQDLELYELVRRPLMLSIFTLAYQGAARADFPAEGTPEAQQRQVFATYVQRMLERRGVSKRFSQEQTRRWLTFVAAGMQQHYQTVFYLERLQPDWLRGRGRHFLYRLSVGLAFGLLAELVIGPIYGLLIQSLNGLAFGLVVGLSSGLIFGMGQIRPREILLQSWKGTKRSIVIGLLGGLLVGLLVWLLYWWVGDTSWSQVLFIWLIAFSERGWLALFSGLGAGLITWLIASLATGSSTSKLTDHLRFAPNQGIWRSAGNGLVSGLAVFLLVELVFGPVYGLLRILLHWPYSLEWDAALLGGLFVGLFVGLPTGLITGLGFGFSAFFQHFTLRFWLWRANFLPWNVVTFLNEAAERLLLRKVGGGYIFVHRLLLDYFADLEKQDP